MDKRLALIIVGNELRYLDSCGHARDYLVDEAKFHPENITALLGAYATNEQIRTTLGNVVSSAGSQPLVVIYVGHGLDGEMYPNGSNGLAYDDFSKPFIGLRGDFIFVNACCYSGSAISSFKERKLLPRKGSVIASVRSDEESYGEHFLPWLFDSFRKGRPFRKIKNRELLKLDTGYASLTHSGDFFQFKEECAILSDGTSLVTRSYGNTPIAEELLLAGTLIYDGTHSTRCGKNLDYLLFARNK